MHRYLALLMACAFAVCADTAWSSTLRFGYTAMDLSNPYFIEVARGARDRAKQLGIPITVHDAKSDPANQVSAFENFIAQKMSAIIVAPIDPNAVEPLVVQAHKAGIKVINSPQKLRGADAWMSIVEYDYGKTIGTIAGQYIRDRLGGKASVALLTFPELPQLIERANGIKAGLHAFAPAAHVVAEQSALTPEKGASATEAILQAHPNVRVLIGVNDAGVLGAYEVVKGMGLKESEFALFGLDATKEALTRIRANGMYKATVDIDPYGTGKRLIDVTLQVLKSGPIKDLIKIPMKPVIAANLMPAR